MAPALSRPGAALVDDLTTVGDPESLGFSSPRLARIASWYQARVDAGDLPGAVVAIARNGKLASLEAIGAQDHARTIPMKPDSIFWIASMTKPVTSVAAMILAEEGKLELDAPVSQYLPELKDMQVASEKTDPATGIKEFVLEPPKRLMTVWDLLRHTAGLVYPPQYFDTPIHRLYGEKVVFARDKTLADLVASLGGLPLAHQPGEVWEYSLAVDVLARVIEVASGAPFDQFLENRIFAPLHMVDSGFYVSEAKLPRLVDAPTPERPHLWDVTKQSRLFSGGGGLVSTAPDYLRFCQMLLNGGELDGVRILTPKALLLMTTNSLPPDIRFVGSMVGPAAGSSWGLGFAIRTDPESSHVPGSVGSFTWGGVWGTYFWIDPAERLIVIQMIQTAPDNSGPYSGVLRNLTYAALRSPMATEPTMKLKGIRQRIEALDADMSGSTFTDVSLSGCAFKGVNLSGAAIADVNMSGWRVNDVNLAGLRISNANLAGASIVESWTDGMTIDGIAVADMIAAYRAANPKAD